MSLHDLLYKPSVVDRKLCAGLLMDLCGRELSKIDIKFPDPRDPILFSLTVGRLYYLKPGNTETSILHNPKKNIFHAKKALPSRSTIFNGGRRSYYASVFPS